MDGTDETLTYLPPHPPRGHSFAAIRHANAPPHLSPNPHHRPRTDAARSREHGQPSDEPEARDPRSLPPPDCPQPPRQIHRPVAYPLPLATHAAVVGDRRLFMHSLENLLAALGTRLTIPRIKGKELDLHQFYKEVTTRGGLQQVIQCKGWKEIVEAMDVLEKYPGASFVLRSHYLNLLYHFEQLYYFRVQGQLLPPPASLPAPSQEEYKSNDEPPYEIPTKLESASRKKKKMNLTRVIGADPATTVGNTVTGAINGKLEEGYLVTVVVGEERLTGVLYHMPSDTNVQQFASVPGLLDGVGYELISPGLEVQLQGKRKESAYKKDPNAPRRMRTGYNIFFKEQRSRLKQLYPEKGKEISRIVIEMWNRLPEEEKFLYLQRSQQDKERYQQEMSEYQERLKLQSKITEGNSCVGQLVEQEMGAYDGSHDYHVTLDSEAEMNTLQAPDEHLLESEVLHGPVHSEECYHIQGYGLPYIHSSYQMNENEGKFPEEDERGPLLDLRYPANEYVAPSSVPEHGYDSYALFKGHPMPEQQLHMGYQHKPCINVSGIQERITGQLQPYYQEPQYEYIAGPAAPVHVFSECGHSVQNAQCRLEVPNSSLLTEQPFSSPGAFASSSMQQNSVASESLGMPVCCTQVCNGQADVASHPLYVRGNQVMRNPVMGTGLQIEQISSGETNQYGYPYSQRFCHPQTYLSQMHFPRAHAVPFGLADAQAFQYKRAFIPYLHQPLVKSPDVPGGSTSPRKISNEGLSHSQKDS